LAKIEREVAVHSEESPGRIVFKMNALEDQSVVKGLYQAAQAGVTVDLIVRDTCRLRPGIEGLSENIRVVSIVGRFLEHSRVYYFRNGGDEEFYIGSADCMKRNLDSRVEIFAPVESSKMREELRFLFDAQLADTRGAWKMRPDGSYIRVEPQNGKKPSSSQAQLIERAEKRLKEATRLKRRKPQGIKRRR
jgi:polyphosphate kinase